MHSYRKIINMINFIIEITKIYFYKKISIYMFYYSVTKFYKLSKSMNLDYIINQEYNIVTKYVDYYKSCL